jgi:hypothetical protein
MTSPIGERQMLPEQMTQMRYAGVRRMRPLNSTDAGRFAAACDAHRRGGLVGLTTSG